MRRRRIALLLLVLVVVLAMAGVGRWLVFDVGGYCAADFLPLDVALDVDPYVQNVTQTSATILWRTPDKTVGTLHYGETVALGNTVSTEQGQSHLVRLSGLTADTDYAYRVDVDGDEGTLRTFRTAPGPEGSFTFAVVGDTGTGGDAQHDVARLLASLAPRLILHTGDVVYRRGAACHYDNRFFDPYQDLLSSTPFYPVLGNHDLISDDGAPYLDAFDLPTNNPGGSERFYSFDYGPVHVVALDSELYHGDDAVPAETQRTWLETDLRQNALPWTVVFLHRPPFSSRPEAVDEELRTDLTPIFARDGVDLVLAGHAHHYERFAPLDGVTYVVTGGGGASLHRLDRGPQTEQGVSAYHALRVTASPDALTIEAVGRDGAVFDRLRLTKAPPGGPERAGRGVRR